MSTANEKAGKPLISVISVVLNAKMHLEQTIQSVINQSYPSIEYLIIDGGSSDGSLEIIKRYRRDIDILVSEPDKGIADAMNKGIYRAGGDYIVFIHGDDYFADNDSLASAVEYIDNIHEIYIYDILFGCKRTRITPRPFNFWINFKGVPHQGVLCKKILFERLGAFDTQFRICMDYDFFVRAYRAGVKAKNCTVLLSVMRDTGISTKQVWQRFGEERRVHDKHSDSWLMSQLYLLYWALYIRYRKYKQIFCRSTSLR